MKTSKQSTIPAVFSKSVQDGDTFAQIIEDAVADLCFLMEQQHGMKFEPYINHMQWCIMIAGRPETVSAQ